MNKQVLRILEIITTIIIILVIRTIFLPPNSSLLNFTTFLGITTESCEDGSSLSPPCLFDFSSDDLSLYLICFCQLELEFPLFS